MELDQFIHDRALTGKALSAKAVTSTASGNGLYQAAHRLYGGWGQALRANGFDPDAVSELTISKKATLGKLNQFIRSRHAATEPLNLQLIRDHYKPEHGVACRLRGGWRQAIEAAL